MSRAIGYVRVSTEEQARDGVSLESQLHKVRGYCLLHDLELIGIESDPGVSGKTLVRPGLTRALTALREGRADGLLIAKLDRLTRSLRDWDALISVYFGSSAKPGWVLWSVADSIDTSSAAGRMVINLLVLIAQWERETISERTADALQHKKSLGQRVSRFVPRGTALAADGRMLEEDAAELAEIDAIVGLAALGLGSREISRRMSGAGSVRGWPESTIRKVLRRRSP